MNYEREASQLLRRLGANSSYVGFYYVTSVSYTHLTVHNTGVSGS